MVGSGRLLFIQNRSLRTALARYMKRLNVIPQIRTDQILNYESSQGPFHRRNLVLSDLGWVGDYRPQTPFDINLEALYSLGFWNLVSQWMALHHDVLLTYERALRDGDQVLALIETEIGNRAKANY